MSDARTHNPWNVPHANVTPEPDFHNRREFIRFGGAAGLAALGLADAASALQSVGRQTGKPVPQSLQPPPGSAFTACEHNDRYTVDRRSTDEAVAARFNNFYEFGVDKDRCWREAQKLAVRPWSIRIEGAVAKPQTIAIDDLIRKMPCEERLYRLRCVERWAMVVPWSGFAFRR